ncbi:hypothetical protein [Streptomyces hydrogenans]|uniref:Secreted protein n=1 Tax=Streptomyces hydrogenans TaxID=1873719 RepID=A0ABQ3PQJ5_9ACTN|nr:hypothetical protein [Streptomyces hydrogenans]GHG24843.1 hypothetical protein GCM10018784_42840 [Streptomyces hydrogenans]GHI27297.1 hypothetical protein Shyd_86680 [Streptomyces hydrogenans]
MDTPNEPEPQNNNTHDVVVYTFLALVVAGAATALWAPKKSDRGFRLLNWLGPFFKAEPEAPESDL